MRAIVARLAGDGEELAISRNALALVAVQVLEVLRGVITLPLITRHFGPSDYGVWASALAVLTLARPILVAGMTPVLVRECSRRPEAAASIVRAAVRLAMIGAAAGLLLATAAGGVMASRPLVFAIAAATLMADAVSLRAILLRVRLRDHLTAAARATAAVVVLATAVWVVVVEARLEWLAVGFLAAAAVRAGMLSRFTARARREGSVRVEVGPLLREGIPMSCAAFLAVCAAHADILLVQSMAGPAETGAYAAAVRVAFVALAVPAALQASSIPALSRCRGDALAVRLCRRSAALGLVAGVGLIAVAPLADDAFGDEFGMTALLLPILAVRVMSVYFSMPIDAWLIATGRQRVVLATHALQALMLVSLDLVAIPRFGALGAALVAASTEVMKAAITAAIAAAIRTRRGGGAWHGHRSTTRDHGIVGSSAGAAGAVGDVGGVGRRHTVRVGTARKPAPGGSSPV